MTTPQTSSEIVEANPQQPSYPTLINFPTCLLETNPLPHGPNQGLPYFTENLKSKCSSSSWANMAFSDTDLMFYLFSYTHSHTRYPARSVLVSLPYLQP